ncbi:GDP-mannose 4,6-dehydratase [Candidatus Methylomirabilis sp.]|uniref:GDP-mannose 4,6-dehydratase n=1 Tax=Candidatus Methylomirabilis sp. TaxID=2032687 RepID=UPI00307648EF
MRLIFNKANDRLLHAKPTVLITGINGFVGSHLADLLISEGYPVSGIALTHDLRHLSHVNQQISLAYGDVRNTKEVADILTEVKPDYIYHLAGSSFVPDAEADPRIVYDVNVLGTLNVLEAARSTHLNARILIVGSGEVYGHVPESALPVSEEYPLKPINLYGVTKACVDMMACQYATAYKMHVIRVRPFNHIGPRQSEQFVCSSFAKQIVEIEQGIRTPILHVGNLESSRDFTDVRDVVRAYRTLLEKAKGGEVYNIGSNRAWKIGDIIGMLIEASRVKEIALEQQSLRVRQNDIPIMRCDTSKVEKAIGWRPDIPIERTLQDLLNYWRETISDVQVLEKRPQGV